MYGEEGTYGDGDYPAARGIDEGIDFLVDEGYRFFCNISRGNDPMVAAYHEPTRMFLADLGLRQYDDAVRKYGVENIQIATAYDMGNNPHDRAIMQSVWVRHSPSEGDDEKRIQQQGVKG